MQTVGRQAWALSLFETVGREVWVLSACTFHSDPQLIFCLIPSGIFLNIAGRSVCVCFLVCLTCKHIAGSLAVQAICFYTQLSFIIQWTEIFLKILEQLCCGDLILLSLSVILLHTWAKNTRTKNINATWTVLVS